MNGIRERSAGRNSIFAFCCSVICHALAIVLVSGLASVSHLAAEQLETVRQFDPATNRWISMQVPVDQIARRHGQGPIAPEVVPFHEQLEAGSIVIDTQERRLYFVQGNGTAVRYGIGVGREGFGWKGSERISRKAEWPGWTPPPAMIRREMAEGRYLPSHMEGGPHNPMGARALYLGNTLYRIHGTNEPWTIGHAVSSGCIRMTNDDVIALYEKVRIGARVIVR